MKRNRIFLDFTTLLDITMIILFWFILRSDASANEAEKAAQEQISQAQSVIARAEEEKKEWQEKADAEMERIRSADKNAAANQQALENFNNSNMLDIRLGIEERDGKWIKTINIISCKTDIGSFEFENTGEINITDKIVGIFDNAGMKSGDVIIGIFVYDGDQYGTAKVLDSIMDSVYDVSNVYPQFYCAVIDISK